MKVPFDNSHMRTTGNKAFCDLMPDPAGSSIDNADVVCPVQGAISLFVDRMGGHLSVAWSHAAQKARIGWRTRSRSPVAPSVDTSVCGPDPLSHGGHDVDAVITWQLELFDAGVIAAVGPRLKIIANPSVGTDRVDLGAAKKARIAVTNRPNGLSNATA